MLQKLYLIPDPNGQESFDGPKLRDAIRSLRGIANWREPNPVDPQNTLFVCELETGDKTAPAIRIQVRKDLRSASIEAFHEAGLAAALDIQRHYRDAIFAFSEESSAIVIAISSIQSPQELGEKLKLR